MTFTSSRANNDRLDAALAWHVCLEGDPREDDWQAFTAWLEGDPQNRAAFDSVDVLSVEIADHAARSLDAQAGAEIIDLRLHRDPARDVVRRPAAARFWIAAAALAAAVAVAFVIQPWNMESPTTRVFATRLGEHQDVQLADGSTVHLNTDTALSVSLGRDVRNVRLDKGEALFEVSHDAARPFIVAVGDRRVRVTGTAFNVLRHDGQVTVSVEHGSVQVSRGDNGEATPVALSPGDRYVAQENGAGYRVVRVDPGAISAWRDGRVVFDDITLSQVVSELNRYYPRPIVINDADVAALHFSGVLRIDEEDDVLRRLAAFLPITVQAEGDKVLLLRGSSK